jgi:hypothetical protein
MKVKCNIDKLHVQGQGDIHNIQSLIHNSSSSSYANNTSYSSEFNISYKPWYIELVPPFSSIINTNNNEIGWRRDLKRKYDFENNGYNDDNNYNKKNIMVKIQNDAITRILANIPAHFILSSSLLQNINIDEVNKNSILNNTDIKNNIDTYSESKKNFMKEVSNTTPILDYADMVKKILNGFMMSIQKKELFHLSLRVCLHCKDIYLDDILIFNGKFTLKK